MERFKNNKTAIFEAAKCGSDLLKDADEWLQEDLDFMKELVKYNGYLVQYGDSYIKCDEEIAELLAIHCCGALRFMCSSILSDKDLMLCLIKINPNVYLYCEIQKDSDIIKCIAHIPAMIKHIPDECITDKMWINAVEYDIHYFSDAPRFIKGIKKYALLALELGDRFTYKSLSEELQCDIDIMKKAVRHNEMVIHDIKHLSMFKNITCERTRVIILELLESNKRIAYNLEKFYDNEEILKAAIKVNAWAFTYAKNEELKLYALDVNPHCLAHAGKKYCQDKEIVKKCVEQDGYLFRYALGEAAHDPELAKIAIKTCPNIMELLKKRNISIE